MQKTTREKAIHAVNDKSNGQLRDAYYRMSDALYALEDYIDQLPKQDAAALKAMLAAKAKMDLGTL